MLTYPQIDPVALAVGPLKIHWYGLMYLIGIGGAWLLASRRMKRFDPTWTKERLSDLVFCRLRRDPRWPPGLRAVLQPGRVHRQPDADLRGLERRHVLPWRPARCDAGGLVVRQAPWQELLPADGLHRPAGAHRPGRRAHRQLHQLGAVGQGQRCALGHGLPQRRPLPRHPSQLYQFALEGVALFVILWLFTRKPRPTASVSGLFVLCYGIFRFVVEFVRVPDAQLGYLAWGWLTMGQVLCVPMVLAGIALMVWAYRRDAAQPNGLSRFSCPGRITSQASSAPGSRLSAPGRAWLAPVAPNWRCRPRRRRLGHPSVIPRWEPPRRRRTDIDPSLR